MDDLRFPPESNIIIVKAKIKASRGVAFANLVFDTGATYVMLPWKLATAVGLPIDPEKTVKTTTASSVETSPLTIIPMLAILGHSVNDVECIVRDLPEASTVDGLLGLSFLKHFNIAINFEEGVLDLEPF